jgi:hypothetical protein
MTFDSHHEPRHCFVNCGLPGASLGASDGGQGMTFDSHHEPRHCFVNCGLPGDECACFRAQMQAVYSDLLSDQEPLGPEFERVWNDNTDTLYEA